MNWKEGVKCVDSFEHVDDNIVLKRLITVGPSIYLDKRDVLQNLIIQYGFWEKWVTDIFLELLKPGMTVLDIGANCGYYSLLAAMYVGSHGKVHAFEPSPLHYDNFIKSIEKNGFNNIQLHQVALTNINGETTLYIPGTGGASIYNPGTPGTIEVKVKTVVLSEYLPEQKIDIIKIDIDGAEPLIMNDLFKLIDRNEKIKIIMEYCPFLWVANGYQPLPILQKFMKRGFSFHIIEHDGTLVPATVEQLAAYSEPLHLDLKIERSM
jgi:FkbM family methyltransferase